ncbi:MAG: DUF4139 domain-containing protein [Planctomycetota bacterium]|jgi:hypothetical protein
MKDKENNLEKNISRLVKLGGDKDKPSEKYSKELIDSAIQELEKPTKGKVRGFRIPAWLGAAAAIIIVGIVLIINTQTVRRSTSEIAKDADMKKVSRKLEGVEEMAEPDASFGELKAPAKPFGAKSNEFKAGLAGDKIIAEAEDIEEQAPFAPASAIELVVLPRRDNVQLTIYNSADLTLVRERRNLTLKRGWNWLQFMWANTLIDPTSLELEPLEQKDKIDIQQLVYPARLREIGRWLIRSETQGQVPFEITYFTSGLNWRAFYMGTLTEDEKAMQLQGYVRIDNGSGEDYEKAQTRLIVGQVHLLDAIAELAQREHAHGRPEIWEKYRRLGYRGRLSGWEDDIAGGLGGDGLALFEELDAQEKKEIIKEGLSEYFLYTIEGIETIPNEWGKRLMSFDVEDIKVKSLYKYDEERWGRNTIRYVSFMNDEEHNLGQTPIPDGTVKIYGKADSEGHLSYVGSAGIKYIPVNEEVELNLGPARLVKVEPILMDENTDSYMFDRKGNIAGWDQIKTWKIKITNTRDLPIDIEITRGFETPYWKLDYEGEGMDYKKHDVTHARFNTTLKPRSKNEFLYTVRTYHGIREEEYSE